MKRTKKIKKHQGTGVIWKSFCLTTTCLEILIWELQWECNLIMFP